MAEQAEPSFTFDHKVSDDVAVAFRCSGDTRRWPWLALDPHHPAGLQSLIYWVSVECAKALGRWDPDKWSALVWTRWQCGEAHVGSPVRGDYINEEIDGKEAFTITLRDRQDRLICTLSGRGVIFRTRDFETWRQGTKDRLAKAPSRTFDYAEPHCLGLSGDERPFLAPLQGDWTEGLADHANAMPPHHPWLDGSGDHVNSAHIAEIARQFACLFHDGRQISVAAGEIHFDRYVELGSPFEIRVSGMGGAGFEMSLTQSGRDCTRIVYTLG